MMLLSLPQGASPRMTFRLIEQGFFGIPPEDWSRKVFMKISDITNDYSDIKHRDHILALNHGFGSPLFPLIETGDFNGDFILNDVWLMIVEPRLPVDVMGINTVEIEDLDSPTAEIMQFVTPME